MATLTAPDLSTAFDMAGNGDTIFINGSTLSDVRINTEASVIVNNCVIHSNESNGFALQIHNKVLKYIDILREDIDGRLNEIFREVEYGNVWP